MNNGVVKETDFEIETCLYEIIFDKQPNRLIGVIYRHPSRNDMKSVEHIKSTIEKIKKENKKHCLLAILIITYLYMTRMRLSLLF